MRSTILALAVLAGAFAFPGSTYAAECYVTTESNTIFVSGFYIWGTAKEIREETNGIEGMQRRPSGCTDGSIVPADICLGGLGLNLNCPFEFLDHKT